MTDRKQALIDLRDKVKAAAVEALDGLENLTSKDAAIVAATLAKLKNQ